MKAPDVAGRDIDPRHPLVRFDDGESPFSKALDSWERPLQALDRFPSSVAVPAAVVYLVTTGPAVLVTALAGALWEVRR